MKRSFLIFCLDKALCDAVIDSSENSPIIKVLLRIVNDVHQAHELAQSVIRTFLIQKPAAISKIIISSS